jgi:hypothetical protein
LSLFGHSFSAQANISSRVIPRQLIFLSISSHSQMSCSISSFISSDIAVISSVCCLRHSAFLGLLLISLLLHRDDLPPFNNEWRLLLADRDQVERDRAVEAILRCTNVGGIGVMFGIASSVGLLTVVPSIAMLRATEMLPRLGCGELGFAPITSHFGPPSRDKFPLFNTLRLAQNMHGSNPYPVESIEEIAIRHWTGDDQTKKGAAPVARAAPIASATPPA